MNAFADLNASFRGWAAIVTGAPEAGTGFRTGPAGWASAVLTVLVALLLSVAAQSAVLGMPGTAQVLFGLLVQAITVALLALVIRVTLRFLGLRMRLATLMVPLLYALAYVFVLAIPLTLIGPNAGLLALLLLAILLFRAARVLVGFGIATAMAFALLCVIVLVAVPNALYMLLLVVPASP